LYLPQPIETRLAIPDPQGLGKMLLELQSCDAES